MKYEKGYNDLLKAVLEDEKASIDLLSKADTIHKAMAEEKPEPNARITKEEIMQVKNYEERQQLIAENLDLFN